MWGCVRTFEALVPYVPNYCARGIWKKTEHFCRWYPQEVAKIVQCGEKFLLNKNSREKAICEGGLSYCEAAAFERRPPLKVTHDFL